MLVLIGGGEIPGWNAKTKDTNQNLYQTGNIDKEIVTLSKKEHPNFLFIGTASRDNEIYYNAIRIIFTGLGCNVSYLKMEENVETQLENADIIYIGGGNTRHMIAEWEKVRLRDKLIAEYKKGKVVAGFSAGAYCFFRCNYKMINGFNIVNAVSCLHYDEKDGDDRTEFYNNIKETDLPGIALDNGVAMIFNNTEFKIIKSIEEAEAFKIIFTGNEYIKQELKENINYKL